MEEWRVDLTDQLLAFLVEAFPDEPLERLHEVASTSLEYQEAVEKALEVEQVVKESPRQVLLQIFTHRPHFHRRICECPEAELEELGDELFMLESKQTSKKTAWRRVELRGTHSRKRPALIPPSFDPWELLGLHGEDVDYSVEDQAEVANALCDTLRERHDLYGRAAEAYRRHNLTGQGQAAYLSEQGRKLSEKVDRLRRRLALINLLRCNPHLLTEPSHRLLDLHHQTVDHALLLMEAFLAAHPDVQLQIVTGAGRHSRGEGGARLKPAIWQRLQTLQRPFSFDGHASFTIHPQPKQG